jgi:mono/diheme cytochrome c family protein
MERETNIEAKWIAVNTPAMSIHHEPETEFEKAAARELAAGKTEYEQVADGMYQRAGVIPLKAGCVGCHTNGFTTDTKTPRFAGLVIRVPVSGK